MNLISECREAYDADPQNGVWRLLAETRPTMQERWSAIRLLQAVGWSVEPKLQREAGTPILVGGAFAPPQRKS
ncbi:hypothetical protein [Methylopila sp. Yamaguchi]|uniref:hypothetical protein n=1 Tax=Methylopila sp. Yamaguchi TaxID=1437817 RepID=UPI000CCB8997|nr:hypothetical protein [Methylopila sp. Yamaguchi]GBD47828.1 hypothetical protein METY_1041 [Methylopila sp. Yamaguchi]